MFPSDAKLAAAVASPPDSIPEVLSAMRAIDAACVDGDGLKWFNWLYLQVTSAVEARVNAGGFADPAWLAALDVQFARLYFGALAGFLSGGACPACWRALFEARNNTRIARVQFAMAGINAHINRDLPLAIVATCHAPGTVPQHGSTQYNDFTALNSTLDALIDTARKTLHVRLAGDALPEVSHLEDLIAAWGTAEARERAWTNSEVLWHLEASPALTAGFLDSLDAMTTFAAEALLVPVP